MGGLFTWLPEDSVFEEGGHHISGREELIPGSGIMNDYWWSWAEPHVMLKLKLDFPYA